MASNPSPTATQSAASAPWSPGKKALVAFVVIGAAAGVAALIIAIINLMNDSDSSTPPTPTPTPAPIPDPTLYVAASGGSNSNNGKTRAAPLASVEKALEILDDGFYTGQARIVLLAGAYQLGAAAVTWATPDNGGLTEVSIEADWSEADAEHTYTIDTIAAGPGNIFPTIAPLNVTLTVDELKQKLVRFPESSDIQSGWCTRNTTTSFEVVTSLGGVVAGDPVTIYSPTVSIAWGGVLTLDEITTGVPLSLGGGIHLLPGNAAAINLNGVTVTETLLTCSGATRPLTSIQKSTWGSDQQAGLWVDCAAITGITIAAGALGFESTIKKSVFTSDTPNVNNMKQNATQFLFNRCYFHQMVLIDESVPFSSGAIQVCLMEDNGPGVVVLNSDVVLRASTMLNMTGTAFEARTGSHVQFFSAGFGGCATVAKINSGSTLSMFNNPTVQISDNTNGVELRSGGSMIDCSKALNPANGWALTGDVATVGANATAATWATIDAGTAAVLNDFTVTNTQRCVLVK